MKDDGGRMKPEDRRNSPFVPHPSSFILSAAA